MNLILKNLACPLFLALLGAVLFSSAVTVQAAYLANQCAADRKGSDLNCTANDVQITGMSVVGDTTSCIGGTHIALDLQAIVNFAVPDRYDIGIFISNDGKSPQQKLSSGGAASCAVSVLPVASPFLDLDGVGAGHGGSDTGDTCGDGNGSIGGGTGSGIHYLTNVNVLCQSLTGAGGNLYIPFVLSWDNQSSPTGDLCTSNLDPVPNTVSKCNSPTVIQGSVAVVVLPTITKGDGDGVTTLFSGSTTNYSVVITNTTGVSLANAVLKDPAVTGIAVNSLTCAAAGGASCPASATVTAMQGSGITIPTMPTGGSVTFTINATLTGNPGDTRANTASVTVGTQSNTASDTDTIVGTIAILPTTQSQNGDKGSAVVYSYTVYNFGASADTISLAAVSGQGWTVTRSPTSVTVPAGGSATVTVTVNIPNGASVGTVDTTILTAVSGNNPSKTATAAAVTTVTAVLTLTPSNTGAGGAGSSVYYSHRVQSNASTSKTVSLTPTFTFGTCTGWTSALYEESDRTTSLSSPVTLAANGGYQDFVLKVTIPSNAAASSTCTATLAAAYTSGAASTVAVTDATTVKILVLYQDPGYTTEQYTYPVGNNVYAKSFGLTNGTPYYYKWHDPAGVLQRTSPTTSNLVSLPDTYAIPSTGPLGTWTVQLWNDSTNTIFAQTNFYVGPDHLKAGYTGANPAVNTSTVIDLTLHDKINHIVPKDASGNLVKGGSTDPKDPLIITVTVSGSATIVSTTLTNATITGQSVTGKLDSTTGTATLTLSDSVSETVTVTPHSYNSALYGSPVRDEPVNVTYTLAVPTVAKAFSPSAISVNGTSVLTITLSNPNSTAITGAAFTDSYPADLVNAGSPNASTTCGGTVTAGSGAVSLSGGAISANGSCTVTVSVTSAQTGSYANTIAAGSVTTANGGSNAVAASATLTVGAVHSFNAFETSTAVGAITGNIHTKLAGTAFSLDAVVISGGAQASSFNENIKVELLNNTGTVGSGYGSDNCPTASSVIQTITSTAISGGRSAVGFSAVPNAYRDVRVRISYPASSPTVIICSTNSFSIRPSAFTITSTDAYNSNTTGGPTIKAGASFNLTAIAVPGYDGTPMITTGNSMVQGSLVSGAISGSFGAANSSTGVATGDSFSYTEVGNFGLNANVVYDDSFTSIDQGSDCTNDFSNILVNGQYGCKIGSNVVSQVTNASGFGRFVPDHFTVIATVTNACAAGSFTYMGQPFTLSTVNAVEAQNAVNNVTQNYAGSYAHGTVSFGAENADNGTDLLSRLTFSNAGSWASGIYTLTSANGTFSRPTATVSDATWGAFESLNIGLTVNDSDVTTSPKVTGADMNPSVAGGTSFAYKKLSANPLRMRFGRLSLQNAYGSELLNLPMPLTAEYWNGSGWVTNTADSCTVLTAPANGSGLTLNLASSGSTTATLSSPLASGNAGLSLSAPGVTHTGYVDVIITSPSWLDFKWDGVNDTDPSARATFGIYKGNSKFIYIREQY